MMDKQIYSVFDLVAGQMFGPLLVLPNHAVARRTFQDALMGEGSVMAPHPADYVLIHIGTINVETGAIRQLTNDPSTTSPIITGEAIIHLQNPAGVIAPTDSDEPRFSTIMPRS